MHAGNVSNKITTYDAFVQRLLRYHSVLIREVFIIPEVSFYVLQWDGTLLWAWKFCRYSRIVVISAVVISEVDCTPKICEIKVL